MSAITVPVAKRFFTKKTLDSNEDSSLLRRFTFKNETLALYCCSVLKH